MTITNIINTITSSYPIFFQLWFGLIVAMMFAVVILKIIAFILDLKFW